MKTRRCVYFLSVLLIAVLVCGLVPSAWADNGCPNGVCNDGLGCPCGCGVKQTHERAYSDFPVYPAMDERYAAPVMDMASSPDMYDDYAVEPVAYVMEAEDDVMKDARAEALLNFMLYAEAAEAQSDPYVRRELYVEAAHPGRVPGHDPGGDRGPRRGGARAGEARGGPRCGRTRSACAESR